MTRWQVPAGKAIAIAAMPTAVLMGLGMTPTLAQARPAVPDNPFQDGPCVAAPEGPTGDGGAVEGAAAPATGRPDGARRTADRPAASDDRDDDRADRSGDRVERFPVPARSRPPLEPLHPSGPLTVLDSLGVGDPVRNLLAPSGRQPPAPAPTASASGSAPGDGVGRSPGPRAIATAREGTVRTPRRDPTGTAPPQPSAPDAQSSAPDAEGKVPFPCAVEKRSDGTPERPAAPIPGRPWLLEASSLFLRGLTYHGVVNLTMPDGRTKQALKFTADDGVDIGDLHQSVTDADGRTYHLRAARGSVSTLRGGRVTMYTERLEGRLFGTIPIVFDPEHPPPLDLPAAYFTRVRMVQAGQFGGDLTVPGLRQSVSD
ncbi:hypothetical protein ACFWIA_22960 [Streptomyces sp. NPDC127068]|uniref:hypothetical protein n=1 Tax=Streptomyces sp. NPDC127068 TaxID=3347127 RepID=UPI00365E2C45